MRVVGKIQAGRKWLSQETDSNLNFTAWDDQYKRPDWDLEESIPMGQVITSTPSSMNTLAAVSVWISVIKLCALK